MPALAMGCSPAARRSPPGRACGSPPSPRRRCQSHRSSRLGRCAAGTPARWPGRSRGPGRPAAANMDGVSLGRRSAWGLPAIVAQAHCPQAAARNHRYAPPVIFEVQRAAMLAVQRAPTCGGSSELTKSWTVDMAPARLPSLCCPGRLVNSSPRRSAEARLPRAVFVVYGYSCSGIDLPPPQWTLGQSRFAPWS